MPNTPQPETVDLSITVLGRTLEHLGVQMYKRRDTAIAELVANCWDAGSTRVDIRIPEPHDYDPAQSTITITDDGTGMTTDQVQNEYLVVGRNRRQKGGGTGARSPLMEDYEKFILDETDETDLRASFQKLRAQVKA